MSEAPRVYEFIFAKADQTLNVLPAFFLAIFSGSPCLLLTVASTKPRRLKVGITMLFYFCVWPRNRVKKGNHFSWSQKNIQGLIDIISRVRILEMAIFRAQFLFVQFF